MRLRIEPVASDGTAKLHFEHDNSSASAPLPKEYYFSKHEETAAVRVQSHARSHHVKKEVKKMKKAATRVQAVSRGHAAKKHVKEKKRVVAAQRIAVEVLQEDVLEAHISRNDVVSRHSMGVVWTRFSWLIRALSPSTQTRLRLWRACTRIPFTTTCTTCITRPPSRSCPVSGR